MEDTFGKRRPEIPYPCPWSYVLIGREEDLVRRAVAEILGARRHALAKKNQSQGGKYCSFEVELSVSDEPDRLSLFEAFKRHADITFVI